MLNLFLIIFLATIIIWISITITIRLNLNKEKQFIAKLMRQRGLLEETQLDHFNKDYKEYLSFFSQYYFLFFAVADKKITSVDHGEKSFSFLSNLTDFIPSPKLRKKLNKLLGDQQDHVINLYAKGRVFAAKFNSFTTWLLCLWYIITYPPTLLVNIVIGIIGKIVS